MSSRCRTSLLPALALALALTACDRETRDYQGLAMQRPDRAAFVSGNAYHLSQGQRLYAWMNCAGCHSHGGGGMGPPLMDDEWRYGASTRAIVRTILDGRPNGMPSFRNRITENQAWQLAAYVRSLSARTREDALSGRTEEPANIEPPTLDERKPVHRVTPDQDDATSK
jgi:cytochrome c oxidase cbb3-type subunit 3